MRAYHIESDHDGCSGLLGIYIDHACSDPTFRYYCLHLPGNVVQPIMGRGADLNYSLHFIYLSWCYKCNQSYEIKLMTI